MKKNLLVLFALTAMMLVAGGIKANAFTGSAFAEGKAYYLYNLYQSKFLQKDGTTLGRTATTADLYTASATGFVIDGAIYQATVISGKKYKLANGNNALMFNAGTSVATGDFTEGYNASKGEWLLIDEEEFAEYQSKKRFTVASLNVDGMPKSVKILGLVDINLNPDGKEGPGATAIGHKLKTMGYDVVGVSEDFNFHSEIWDEAWNNGVTDAANGIWSYNATTHRGGINITADSYGKFITQSTVFDTDGLCLFYKTANVDQNTLENSESWTSWNEHYGFTNNGADGLINKGYRYYTVKLADGTEFDLYILHMDAETDPEDNAARQSQIVQLATAIKASKNSRPIIVMGDTNCRYSRDKLEELFIGAIEEDPRFTVKDPWIEFGRDGIYPTWDGTNDHSIMVHTEGYLRGEVVDKVFYINNSASNVQITALNYAQDLSFINEDGEPLADHWPAVVEFEYSVDETAKDIETYKWVGEDPTAGGTYYIYHPETGKFLTHEGSNIKTEYTTTTTWTITPSGNSFTMQSNGGYYFNLTRDGLGAKPQLSTSSQTTELKASSTNKEMNAFKIWRQASPTRYFNFNGSQYTGAQNQGTQNDWVFIPVAQYEKQHPQDYIENGVHYFKGIYAEGNAPTITVSAPSSTGAVATEAYDIDLTYATGAGISAINVDVTNNPNALIYAKIGDVSNIVNVVDVRTDKCANLVIDDAYPFYAPSAFTAEAATYSRQSASTWGTIILPYAPVKKEGYTYFTLISEDVNNGVLKFQSVDGELSANTPYLYRNTTGEALDLSTTDATVYKAANIPNIFSVATGVDAWTMTGVYERTSVFASDSHSKFGEITNSKVVDPNAYYIKADGSGFVKVNGYFNLSAFRAYFSAGENAAKPATLSFTIEDETNGINQTVDSEDKVVGCYNAYGVLQNGVQTGLNIIKYKSGKTVKVMIK